jgi:spore photoproduct lyase
MIDKLYIEAAIQEHPRVKDILSRFPKARVILCERYGEVFNPRAQNFRLQKQQPALILAEKYQKFALPAPSGYSIGQQRNFYFSHMLNCIYDCRYCFLQGMYQSANYVVFVNYEDFQRQIREICLEKPDTQICFFSGYDCDSLAYEPVTNFAKHFLEFFAEIPNAWLELRTKSTQIRSLLDREVVPRCVVAFSLTPESIADKVEKGAPAIAKRLDAAVKLQNQGWSIGLRFDPLIYQHNYRQCYHELFEQVFKVIKVELIHSISFGVFRLPEQFFKKILKHYPDEKLFASPLQISDGMMSYHAQIEAAMMHDCETMLREYVPQTKIFPCRP